jgi:hypothetical protein
VSPYDVLTLYDDPWMWVYHTSMGKFTDLSSYHELLPQILGAWYRGTVLVWAYGLTA